MILSEGVLPPETTCGLIVVERIGRGVEAPLYRSAPAGASRRTTPSPPPLAAKDPLTLILFATSLIAPPEPELLLQIPPLASIRPEGMLIEEDEAITIAPPP